MAARAEWALLACLILFILSGVAANKFNSMSGSHKLVKSTSYRDGLTIAKLHNSKSVVGTCEFQYQYLADSFDCSIFYICDGTPLTPQQQKCPDEGTCFNATINQCDVDCSCLPCQEEGTELLDPENCAAYYICTEELKPPLHVPCGRDQFYDADKMGCYNATTVACGTRPGCLAPYDRFPNFQSCSSFYFCNGTLTPLPSQCPAGECFNEIINSCNTITGTDCTVPCSTTPNEPTTTLTTSTTPRPTIPNWCTEPAQILPDPYSCTEFYICFDSSAGTRMYCNRTSQLFYDPFYENCNYKDAVICYSGDIRPTPMYPANFNPTSTPCTTPGQLSGEQKDCQIFYKCNANKMLNQYTCPEGLSFSQPTLTCDRPEAVPPSMCERTYKSRPV